LGSELSAWLQFSQLFGNPVPTLFGITVVKSLCRTQVVKLDGKSDTMSPDKAGQLPVDPEGTTWTDKLAVGSPPNATIGAKSAAAKDNSLIKLNSLENHSSRAGVMALNAFTQL